MSLHQDFCRAAGAMPQVDAFAWVQGEYLEPGSRPVTPSSLKAYMSEGVWVCCCLLITVQELFESSWQCLGIVSRQLGFVLSMRAADYLDGFQFMAVVVPVSHLDHGPWESSISAPRHHGL